MDKAGAGVRGAEVRGEGKVGKLVRNKRTRFKEIRKKHDGILLLEAEKTREQLSLISVGCSKEIWRWLLINNCPGRCALG